MSKSTPAAKVIPFEYHSTEIKTIKQQDGSVWFLAKDVCDVLGISKYRDALSRLDDDERGSVKLDTLGGPQNHNTINESGLYTLILRSNKPEAKPFRKWVTSEVLPAIRKTGAYTLETLTPAQQRDVQRLVAEKVMRDNNGGRNKGHFMTVYRSIKNHFQVAKYSQVPQTRFAELTEFLGGARVWDDIPEPRHTDADQKAIWENIYANRQIIVAHMKQIQNILPEVFIAISRMGRSEALIDRKSAVTSMEDWTRKWVEENPKYAKRLCDGE